MALLFLEMFYRAFELLLLTLYPPWRSPEPLMISENQVRLYGALSTLGFVVTAFFANRFVEHLGTKEARAFRASASVAFTMLLGSGLYFRGEQAPLARAVWPVAFFVWLTLGLFAASLAGSYLGSSFKNKRTVSAVVVVLGGGAWLSQSSALLGSPDRMWAEVLKRDASDVRAIEVVTRGLISRSKFERARKIVDTCLAKTQEPCDCLIVSAEIAIAEHDLAAAQRASHKVATMCPSHERGKALVDKMTALQTTDSVDP